MSYYIIIRGPLGCGKSTIAKRLTNILQGEYISIDEVLKELGLDKIDKKLGCIPPESFIKANEKVFPEVKDKLSKGKPVIFDACFYHKEPIEHLIENLPYPHYVFTLKASVEVCIKRDNERKKTYGEEATRVVHGFVSRFDYGTVIDIDKPLGECVDEILSYLPK